MYKLRTELKNFTYNTIHNLGPYIVTWYKLQEIDQETEGVCLSQQELKDLIEYVCNNKVNFNNQNYFKCDQDDTTGCNIYDLLPSKTTQPRNLIIRRNPQMVYRRGTIATCMDIKLLNSQGGDAHNYNLEFDIIGKIENDF